MRRRFYILLILLGSVLHVSAGLTSEEQTLRDSIFNVYHSMPADTMRVEYLKSMYQQNIRADWSIELADSALQAARVLGNGRLELMLFAISWRFAGNGTAVGSSKRMLLSSEILSILLFRLGGST